MTPFKNPAGTEGKKLVPAISTSLALAAGIGIAEALALFSGSGYLLNIMGIDIVRKTFVNYVMT